MTEPGLQTRSASADGQNRLSVFAGLLFRARKLCFAKKHRTLGSASADGQNRLSVFADFIFRARKDNKIDKPSDKSRSISLSIIYIIGKHADNRNTDLFRQAVRLPFRKEKLPSGRCIDFPFRCQRRGLYCKRFESNQCRRSRCLLSVFRSF